MKTQWMKKGPAEHRSLRIIVVFTVLFFKQRSWVLIGTLPPEALTFYDVRARISKHFVFALMKIVLQIIETLGKFLRCFSVLLP